MNKEIKYLIVGLGLMGGSVAKALSLKGYKVYGYDINIDAINYAYENKIIIQKRTIKLKDTLEIIGCDPFILLKRKTFPQ